MQTIPTLAHGVPEGQIVYGGWAPFAHDAPETEIQALMTEAMDSVVRSHLSMTTIVRRELVRLTEYPVKEGQQAIGWRVWVADA